MDDNLYLMGQSEVGGGQEFVVVKGDVASVGAHLNCDTCPQFPQPIRATQLISVRHSLEK